MDGQFAKIKIAELDNLINFCDRAWKILRGGHKDELWDDGPNFSVSEALDVMDMAREWKSRLHAIKQNTTN